MDIRRSPAIARNRHVVRAAGRKGSGNRQWFAARAVPGSVVFVGGADLADFRVRFSQSAVRHDLLPGFWSLVGIADSSSSVLTAPLSVGVDPSVVPASNGVRRIRFAEFDDPNRFPNVGVIHFADHARAIVGNVRKLKTQRSAIDIPSLLLPWLGFVWGAGDHRNPLLDDVGLPSAVLVETAFGMSGIELTPGLGSGSSCPEAIWQAACWWHEYYRDTADVQGAGVATDPAGPGARPKAHPHAVVPRGEYWLRQEAAAVTCE